MRRGAHLAAELGGAERRQGARWSVAVLNGEGVASGSATIFFNLDNYFHINSQQSCLEL